jgi:hypothetical protein
MTSRGEQFRYTGSVETSFRKTESRSQTSTSGTNNDSIVFMILWPSASGNYALPLKSTYNDGILLRNGAGSLLCAKRMGTEYPSFTFRQSVTAMEGYHYWQSIPAGLVEEKRRLWSLNTREIYSCQIGQLVK